MDNTARFTTFRPLVGMIFNIGCLGFLLLFGAATVSAATISVSAGAVDTVINSNCSLIEAIISANTDSSVDKCVSGSGPDELVLAKSTYNLTGTHTLQDGENGLPPITTKIAITGNNSEIRRVSAATFRFFHITSSGKLTISKLTVTGGIADDDFGTGLTAQGGAFFVDSAGYLSLTDCLLDDNQARKTTVVTSDGGAIYARSFGSVANVKLINTTLSNNHVDDNGGGLAAVAGSLVTLRDSTIKNNTCGNHGGGLYLFQSDLTVEKTTFSDNEATDGGAIFASGDSSPASTVTISDSTFSGNKATGDGGGIYSWGLRPLTINRSTVSKNEANGDGGGISLKNNPTANSTANLKNSTCSFNSSDGHGGGILVDTGSTLNLLYATVASNTADADNDSSGDGGGVYNSVSTVNATNSIIADNQKYLTDQDCSAAAGFTVNGIDLRNWFGDTTCSGAGSGDPKLGALVSNGGPTRTQALKTGSGAIDQIAPANCDLNIDQRGYSRPSGTHCDIGAYEYQKGSFYILPTPDDKAAVIYLE